MVVNANAVFINSVMFTRALPALLVTLSVGIGAVFADRFNCLHILRLVITSSLGTCVRDSRVGQ